MFFYIASENKSAKLLRLQLNIFYYWAPVLKFILFGFVSLKHRNLDVRKKKLIVTNLNQSLPILILTFNTFVLLLLSFFLKLELLHIMFWLPDVYGVNQILVCFAIIPKLVYVLLCLRLFLHQFSMVLHCLLNLHLFF
jgi:NADH:ubiquinone oxidoreductase subunit 2 (subunit N)